MRSRIVAVLFGTALLLAVAGSAHADCTMFLDRERTRPGASFGVYGQMTAGEHVTLHWMDLDGPVLDEFVVGEVQAANTRAVQVPYSRTVVTPADAAAGWGYVVADVVPAPEPEAPGRTSTRAPYTITREILVEIPGSPAPAAPAQAPAPPPPHTPSSAYRSPVTQPQAAPQPVLAAVPVPAPVLQAAEQPATAPSAVRAPVPVRRPDDEPATSLAWSWARAGTGTASGQVLVALIAIACSVRRLRVRPV